MDTAGKESLLLVEDETVVALAETRVLLAMGYSVRRAATGEDAVAMAVSGGVDLVLMDIDLGPGIDGPEAARRILESRDLPIVFLTSHAERKTVERVRGITRYGYVIKDSGSFVLQSSIEMAFELYRAHRELKDGQTRLSSLVRSIPDLVWLKDARGVYLACNQAFEGFFGAAEKDIVGKTDYDFVPESEADAFRANDLEAIKLGKPRSNEEWVTYAGDGRRAFLETIKTPLVDEEGTLVGVLGIARDITEHKGTAERLARSAAEAKRRLQVIEEPEFDLTDLGLSEIVDVPTITALMESFSNLTGLVTALLDTTGKVLLATGWQDICVKFHRRSPETSAACTQSDLFLAKSIKPGDFLEYRCANGLYDVVTPLYVDERHVGNIYSGQYFHNDGEVDAAEFQARARRHGFDEAAYLEALARVPRISPDRVRHLMEYLVRLTRFISHLSYSNLSLARVVQERTRAEELLSVTIQEKEVLFKELQHRVKNSLNLVSSLLSLNMDKLEDESSRVVFREAVDRVSCVSMIYDKLSRSTESGSVELDLYLGDLMDLLLSSYAKDDGGLIVERQLAKLRLDLKRTVSLGLIFNELFTNALKYSRSAGGQGRITVTLEEVEGRLCLRVGDEGPGLPPGFDLAQVKSLGLRISSLLAGELGGSLGFESRGGTVASLCLPLEPDGQRRPRA